MKILLYEPGSSGHRPVILRYTTKILEQHGIEWVHENQDLSTDPELLVLNAMQTGCDVIYVMTLERLAWFTWRVSRHAHPKGIRVVATYYLFSNLKEGLKQWVWRALLLTGHIETIFISDDGLKNRFSDYPRQVKYLPDPWDPADFAEWPQSSAREKLNLPKHSVIFLLFGLINERKGAELLLAAITDMDSKKRQDDVIFLFAGQCSYSVKEKYVTATASMASGIKCVFVDRHIPEDQVSLFFYAADYVINAYPLDFKVSSGGVTRALAAGRPSLVPNHGVNADLVKQAKCGLIFASEDVESLKAALLVAVKKRQEADMKTWHGWCARAKAAGADRTLDVYAKFLIQGLYKNEN